MDAIKSPSTKRIPLGGLDVNRRNTPSTPATKKHSEDVVLGKRMTGDEEEIESAIAEGSGGAYKRRKVDGYGIGEGVEKREKMCDGVLSTKVEDYESEGAAGKGNEVGGIEDEDEDEDIPTQNSSPTPSSFENNNNSSSQKSTIPHPNSQETNITEPDHDEEGENREAPIGLDTTKQQAHALRSRLRIAMYKVHTNQTSTPLSRLEVRSCSSFSTTTSSSPSLAWMNRDYHHHRCCRSNPSHKREGDSTYSPVLRENSAGEALLGGGARGGDLGGNNAKSSSSFQELKAQRPKAGIPYAKQKRRVSVSSNGSEDIEKEVENLLMRPYHSHSHQKPPPRTTTMMTMAQKSEDDGKKMEGLGSSALCLVGLQRRCFGDVRRSGGGGGGGSLSRIRSFDRGYPGRSDGFGRFVSSDIRDDTVTRDEDVDVNVIRSRRDRDDVSLPTGPDRNRNQNRNRNRDGNCDGNCNADIIDTTDTDELGVAAGGLLKLMSQGRMRGSFS